MSDLGPDNTELDGLEDQTNRSLNVGSENESGLIGKFRSSLKKKISVKALAGRSPSKKKEKKEPIDAGDAEVENPHEEGHEHQDGEGDSPEKEPETYDHDTSEVNESAFVAGTEDTPDGSVQKKKKKKKKKRAQEDVEPSGEEPVESTPMKASIPPLDLDESPVAAVDVDENGTTSYVHTEETTTTSYAANGENNEVVVKTVKTRKTKRKKKQVEQSESVEDDDVV